MCSDLHIPTRTLKSIRYTPPARTLPGNTISIRSYNVLRELRVRAERIVQPWLREYITVTTVLRRYSKVTTELDRATTYLLRWTFFWRQAVASI